MAKKELGGTGRQGRLGEPILFCLWLKGALQDHEHHLMPRPFSQRRPRLRHNNAKRKRMEIKKGSGI